MVGGLSGGIGVMLTIAAVYFQWVAKNPKAALWIAAAIAFFIAGYRAWLKEHRKLEALQNKTSRSDFVTEKLKRLIDDYQRLNVPFEITQDPVAEAHQLSEHLDYCTRGMSFLERYFDKRDLAVYEEIAPQELKIAEMRDTLEDVHRRLVEGEIEIKPYVKSEALAVSRISVESSPAYLALKEKYTTATSQTEAAELKLRELTRHKLFLEVDTKGHMNGKGFRQSGVSLFMGLYDIAPPTAPNPETVRRYIINATLYVRLDNRDGAAVSRVNEITVTLKTKNHGDQIFRVQAYDLFNKTIGPAVKTDYYQLDCEGDYDRPILDALGEECFLRLSLDAPNQDLYCVDLNVDWAKARYTAKEVPCTIRAEGICVNAEI